MSARVRNSYLNWPQTLIALYSQFCSENRVVCLLSATSLVLELFHQPASHQTGRSSKNNSWSLRNPTII